MLDDEQRSGRWTRLALAWAGPLYALQIVLSVVVTQAVIDNLRAIDWSADDPDVDLLASVNSGALTLNQLAGVAVLVAQILFLVWFYRSVSLARAAGLPARRSPALAVVAWIIPILNWWWPYQSTVDALPPGHPARTGVLRWWLLWIAASNATFVAVLVGLASEPASWVVAAAGTGCALAAAFAARDVVEDVVAAHAQLAR